MAPTSAPLYRERLHQVTSFEQIDQCLQRLAASRERFRDLTLPERITLARSCLAGLQDVAHDWVTAACKAKGISANSPLRGEEMAAGPVAVARYLQLLIRSLHEIDKHGVPQLPGAPALTSHGRLSVPVLPTPGLYDRWLFAGFRAEVWMKAGVTRDNLKATQACYYQQAERRHSTVLVLGAGNVSSIAPTDAFYKLFHEGQVVLLKMNPVNEYLGPFYARAFASLLDAGFLQIIYGGAEVGGYAAQHPLIDALHVTGSLASHESIVWGADVDTRAANKAAKSPQLRKPITSELGNVTPWIVVPGPFRERELDFQAENTAAMIVNNASFNCIAAKMIVTWKHWPQRARFLGKVRAVLDGIAPRPAYYPGAADRFRRFAGDAAVATPGGQPDREPRCLPWTLYENLDVDSQPLFFDEESFVCVCGETTLDASSEEEFLVRATEFVNQRMWGTLGAGILIHPKFRQAAFNEELLQNCLAQLEYGTIGINHWPALSYAMMSPPWGGHPGGSLDEPRSGIGWVHNTYMLEQAEKTIFSGPLTLFPKPLWFPTHRRADRLADRLFAMTMHPSLARLAALLPSALRG